MKVNRCKEKGAGLVEFVLAEFNHMVKQNKYENVTKSFGTSVFLLLLMISADICNTPSKANKAFLLGW